MNELIDFAILSFTSLFVIVDPIATVPAFLAMTHRDSQPERLRMATLASCVAAGVLGLFALGGHRVLSAFGITVPAFEIAGGIVLLKVALDMLQARRTALNETPEEQAAGAKKEDVAITPLGVPMLAGPGAITAVLLLTSEADSWEKYIVVLLNIFLVCGITYLILRLSVVRPAIFSTITLRIMTRLMGLLLAAIAVQFIVNGVGTATLKPLLSFSHP